MIVKTLWITRTCEPDTPELLCAVDEYAYDSYPEWFDEECKTQLAGVGDEVQDKGYINIHIPHDLLMNAIRPMGDIEALAVNRV